MTDRFAPAELEDAVDVAREGRAIAERGIAGTVDGIRRARAHDALLTVTAYCQATACSVREVTIAVKDYDRTLCKVVARRGLACPVCGAPVVLIRVRTALDEAAERTS